MLCVECYACNDSLYITDIDSNFELATKEDYNRERESISEAIEEVLRNYDKNRQND